MHCPIIPFPQELRPSLPTIVGNVDYLTLRQRLEQIDHLLIVSGLERHFVLLSLAGWCPPGAPEPTVTEQVKFQQRSRRALRCNLLRTLLQENYRGFSCQLAGNPLYQWFCQVDALDQVRVPSKSELQRFAHWLPADPMRQVIDGLLKGAVDHPVKLGLREELDLEAYFLDSTCVAANIHFPTDWVLLRDGVRTLMKATRLIRETGLCARMESPEEFLRRMNRLCIQMTQQTRRGGRKKERKRVLRAMKKLVGVVRAHARRHRDLLDQQWELTEWTRAQAEQILRRIDGVLELLPRAQKQAHERIIGERSVANDEKILSLYDTELRVIVRGKAGAEVEFGNTLLLGENRQGLILDYELFRESAPADSQLLFASLLRVEEALGRPVGAAVTDRGFASAANSRTLKEAGTFDGLCPRKPAELQERMKGAKFARLQRRRGQTEGRIGILKQGFLGRPMRAKGFEHRQLALAWGVLTHNLWKLAKMTKIKKKKKSVSLLAAA
jgi:IS5 family transposase